MSTEFPPQDPPPGPPDPRFPPPPQPSGRPGTAEGPARPSAASIRTAALTPWVTYTLLALSIGVYIAQMLSVFVFRIDWPAEFGLKINQAIAQGQLWRLITPMFLHGSILHIAFNMYALYIFGPSLERYFGHGRFLALYAISGFAGNVASLMFSEANSLGSSTAIFGLLGAQGVFVYQNRELLGQGARRALNNIISIAAINLIIGLSPQIDNWGHIGGLVGGTLFTWFAGPIMRIKGAFPELSLSDERETGDIVRAGVWVTLLFAFLAAVTILLRT